MINVAYDITFLAHNYFRPNCKTGIFRVIEEVLFELLKQDGLHLTLVGVCNPHSVLTSILSRRYLKDRRLTADGLYREAYRSRFGLEERYRAFAESHFLDKAMRLHQGTISSLVFWGLMRGLAEATKPDLYQKIDHRDIDVFHSPFLRLPKSTVARDIPRILTVYDLIPLIRPDYANWQFRLFFRSIIKSIDIKRDFVVCISEYTKQEFCNYTNMNPDRVFVTPLAAAGHFHPVRDPVLLSRCRATYAIPDGEYVLTLAALQPRKNINHLIRCFIQLLKVTKRSDITLVLVGATGWKYDEIFMTMESYPEYRDRILFTGYIPDDDLAPLYSGARCFVFPSLYEGFGLPLLEAMQCGVPVVSSNTTSLPEVVGDAGIMVNPTDENALCQAMLDIIDNDQLWLKLRAKGLERATQFSWGKCAADTVNVYKKITGN